MLQFLVSRTALAAAAAFVVACAPAQASPSTVDFESVDPGLYLDHESFVDNGFRLTVLGDFAAVDTSAACFIATCPSGNDSQFFQGFNDGRVSLARADGLDFRLLGFDAGFIAPLAQTSFTEAGALRLQAETADGRLIDRTFLFPPSGEDGSFPFARYGSVSQPLGGMGLLRSVQFFACTWDADGACSNPNENLGQFALDNVVLQPVPEPSTLALLALGLGGIALRRGRAGKEAL